MKTIATTLLSVLMLASCSTRATGNYPEQKPIRESEPVSCVHGGDISMLTLVEDNGGKYYWDGVQADCVKGLAANGFDIVRLRLYNDPGNPSYTPSKRLPKGYQDQADILRLAQRAKAEGLQIELTFHYSDYWTNGGQQVKPHDWSNLSGQELEQAVYDFTCQFLGKMKNQGTLPEYISLGNESQAGILYPDGSVDNISTLCALYNAGAKACREMAPEARIIIHSDDGGNLSKYQWLYSQLKSVDYDIIGTSYYPFWTGKNVSQFISFAEKISAEMDKDIMIMETGYAWNPTLPSGWPGQLQHNKPYTEMTPQGQLDFMNELFAAIDNSDKCRVVGVLYWDPIFIEAGDAGWETGGDNVVSNTTLFDFEGNALPVFDAFRNH